MPLQVFELKKYNYFRNLSSDSLEMLSQKFNVMTFPKGKEISQEGHPADSFYFVKQGRLEVIKNTKYGLAKLSIITSGQGFGEVKRLDHETNTMCRRPQG